MNSIKKYKRLFIILLILIGANKISLANGLYNENDTSTCLYMADPTIYCYNGNYYLYGTYDVNSNDGIKVYVSKSLTTFSEKSSFLALKKGDAYGTANFWAPQIWKNNGKFYMAYVANEHIAIAEASNPKGPFIGGKEPLIKNKKTIDPFLFKDDNGKIYLFHVEFSGGNKIYVAQLKDDLSGIYDNTDSLCLFAQDNWEKIMGNVIEGPTVLKHNGWYYLIYSANHFKSKYYAVGYAISKSVYGPWKRSNDNPILSIEGTGKSGTGHGDIFYNKSYEMYYVFHTHNSDSTIGPRKTALTKAYFIADKNGGPDRLVFDQRKMQYFKLKQGL
jgi:beta-xylosidase